MHTIVSLFKSYKLHLSLLGGGKKKKEEEEMLGTLGKKQKLDAISNSFFPKFKSHTVFPCLTSSQHSV